MLLLLNIILSNELINNKIQVTQYVHQYKNSNPKVITGDTDSIQFLYCLINAFQIFSKKSIAIDVIVYLTSLIHRCIHSVRYRDGQRGNIFHKQ